jgi:hypothetical protein
VKSFRHTHIRVPTAAGDLPAKRMPDIEMSTAANALS